MEYWKRTTFWNKLKDTFALFGTGGQVVLALSHTSPYWNLVAGIATIMVMIFTIWMDDRDNNGVVDLFEKEVIVKVTSDTPIQVETKTETKTTTE